MRVGEKKGLVMSLIIIMFMVLVACGENSAIKSSNDLTKESTEQENAPEPEVVSSLQKEMTEEYKPFSIQNYHRLVTFNDVPKRVVSLNGHTTEVLFALGLEDRIVGTAYQNTDTLPQFEEAFAKVPVLAEKYPSLEVFLNAEPDFVFGRESAFNGDNQIGSVEDLEAFGIKSYVAKGTYILGAKMDDVYEDILNLGRIFQIENQANELVLSMQEKIKEIQDIVGEVENPIRVVVMDAGGDTLFTAAQSLQTTLITMAGGKNVFDDIAKTWARVSWEEMVERDPEVILINNYGETSAEDKIKEMMENPALQNVTAIKNDHFVILPLASVFEGVRNVEALRIMASGFYPEKFAD